jgi:hypothetical protein
MSICDYDYSFAVPVDKVNKILKDNIQHIDLELAYTCHDTESGYMKRMDATMLPLQIIIQTTNQIQQVRDL